MQTQSGRLIVHIQRDQPIGEGGRKGGNRGTRPIGGGGPGALNSGSYIAMSLTCFRTKNLPRQRLLIALCVG